MKNYLSILNKLILMLLAFLGFSCDPNEPGVEYGMPCADFKVNGNIVDEISLEKISNIQVVLQNALSSTIHGDTAYSDENGNYEVSLNDFPGSNAFIVNFKDVDGTRNGSYLATDTIIDFSDIEFTDGDGSWYSGEKSKELNIKLSPDEAL